MRKNHRLFMAVICCIVGTLTTKASIANTYVDNDPNTISFNTPQITDGLQVVIDKHSLTLQPGKVWINDKPFEINKEIQFEVKPCPKMLIRGEQIQMRATNKPGESSCILKECLAVVGTLNYSARELLPGSVTLKNASTGKPYIPGYDYSVEIKSGVITRIPTGRMKADEKLLVDYDMNQRRIDYLVIIPNGTPKLLLGTVNKSIPILPKLEPNTLVLANVAVDANQSSISKKNVFPIGTTQLPPTSEEQKQKNHQALKKTINKLKHGQNLKIVFWGDSITAGFCATHGNGFTDVVTSKLQQKFPGSKLSIVNSSISGSSVLSRLSKYESDVLSNHPDLIVIEFTNDYPYPESRLKPAYLEVIKKALASGSEIIFCSPHMISPHIMKVKSWEAVAHSPVIKLVHQMGKEFPIAIADVTIGCQNLSLAPNLILEDKDIHPNDLGHQVYAQEILKCFE